MTRSLSRRSFVAGISASAVLSPLTAATQQAGRIARIGGLSSLSASAYAPCSRDFGRGRQLPQ
jgi:hypothetical protein